MNELAELREALADKRLSVVAKRAGLSVPTVRAIRDGTNENPTLSTLEALRLYLGCTPE